MKIVFTVLLLFFICTGIFAQNIIYVSARGNDNNTGLIETSPLKTLSAAFTRSVRNNINIITVIGRLDINSEGVNRDIIFILDADTPMEILITGKPDAIGAERAIISALGTNYICLNIENARIRLEHIEISGGAGEYGVGLFITEKAQVTLGEGAIVKDNERFGVLISGNDIIFIMDGGEVRNNNETGVFVGSGNTFYMKNGIITENRANIAAGVFVGENARFEMSGGSITRNRANDAVGGVFVNKRGVFINTGGTVSNNFARRTNLNANIYRMR